MIFCLWSKVHQVTAYRLRGLILERPGSIYPLSFPRKQGHQTDSVKTCTFSPLYVQWSSVIARSDKVSQKTTNYSPLFQHDSLLEHSKKTDGNLLRLPRTGGSNSLCCSRNTVDSRTSHGFHLRWRGSVGISGPPAGFAAGSIVQSWLQSGDQMLSVCKWLSCGEKANFQGTVFVFLFGIAGRVILVCLHGQHFVNFFWPHLGWIQHDCLLKFDRGKDCGFLTFFKDFGRAGPIDAHDILHWF